MADYYHYWGKAENDQLKVAYCSGKNEQDKNEILSNAKFKEQIAKKLQLPTHQAIGLDELEKWANTVDKKQGKEKWQFAKKDYAAYHLLPYHCLDVAAVASCWWDASPGLRQQFTHTMQLDDEQQARAWVLFFVALHDYGKFDVRFQRKATQVHELLQPDFKISLSGLIIKEYAHGEAGFSLFNQDFQNTLWSRYDCDLWDQWQPYLSAVMGHHGSLPSVVNREHFLKADSSITNAEKQMRLSWISVLENLFLKPVQLSLQNPPPNFQLLITGFCSVCDWLGSKQDDFTYQTHVEDLTTYFNKRLAIAHQVIQKSGLISQAKPYSSIHALLNAHTPRQLQTLVDKLPQKTGLTIIEAPTGSGKTEAAVAYAWRLLDKQLADSIIFALPTQATSNAMFERLENMATVLFGTSNIVLAHGKARFNKAFWQLQQRANPTTAQEHEEANVQCAEWLAGSRKRVFLGQIGVCTVDQVLVSVLPIRHNFVRGFGLGKSVLIVDEVHAYDRYMIGLLDKVIEQQKQSGGSVILLSATLPVSQKQALLKAWGTEQQIGEQASYPLITHSDTENHFTPFILEASQQPQTITVSIDVLVKPDLLPDSSIIEKMLDAAEQGVQVVFICNLVDVAQTLAEQLQLAGRNVDIELFHARYRFCDRQAKEENVLNLFGKDSKREKGRILIATQVVEQSLDLDFDWMLTQLCPVDLLFQRLGRLHRHERKRPKGFEQARCTVLIPDDDNYGLHKLIYGNSRVLWRTAELLKQAEGKIEFPNAYRTWINKVYEHDDWDNEPEQVSLDYDEFHIIEEQKFNLAQSLTQQDITAFSDTDANVSFLTRDGEMNLNVLPVMETEQGKQLLDGTQLINVEKWFKDEPINKNIVSVPHSWRFLPNAAEDGLIYLVMQKIKEGIWQTELGKNQLLYDSRIGLVRTKK